MTPLTPAPSRSNMAAAKHNPKLNPCPPYRDLFGVIHSLSLDERRKVAVQMLVQAVKDADRRIPPSDRAIRKACGITGRQFRKALREVSDNL